MSFQKIPGRKKFNCVALLLVMSVFVMCGATNAHMFVLKPDKMKAAKGEAVTVWAGLAEPLVALDMSKAMLFSMGYESTMEAAVQYPDGTESLLPADAFVPANAKNPADTAWATATAEAGRLQIAAEGTAVLHGKFTMLNKEKKRTVCFGKTFLNLTDDGMLTKRYAGDDVAEIVFKDNVKSFPKGKEIAVQVLLKGKPLADAEVSATFDGAPAKKADSPENEYLTVKTDATGEAKFTPDSANLWVITIEYTDPGDGIRYRSSALFQVE